jgi:hypothetical protein
MRVSSWMAALALIAATLVFPSLIARAQNSNARSTQDQEKSAAQEQDKVRETDKDRSSRPADPNYQSVQLNLVIAGLGREGCDVDIKPGNRGCRFQPVSRHISSQGKATLALRDIELRSADRNCTFAITVRESGQAPKTIYRGFRVPLRSTTTPDSTTIPSFTCFMSSPSKLAKLEEASRTRR